MKTGKNNKIFMYLLFIVVTIIAIFRLIDTNERLNLKEEDLTKEVYILESYDEQEDYIYLYFNDAIGIIDKNVYFDENILNDYINSELNVYYIDTNEVDIDFEIVIIKYNNLDIFSLDMFLKEVKRNQNINIFFIVLFPILLVISLFTNSNYFKSKIKKKKLNKIDLNDPTTRSNYDKIRGAILYKRSGYYLSDKLEVDEDIMELLLPKVLFDMLSEGELRVIKDNEDGYMVAFKINDELFFEYTLLDDDNHDTIYITMSYPSERDILDEEFVILNDKINEYNSINKTNIKVNK